MKCLSLIQSMVRAMDPVPWVKFGSFSHDAQLAGGPKGGVMAPEKVVQ